jgi:hypothetical protein
MHRNQDGHARFQGPISHPHARPAAGGPLFGGHPVGQSPCERVPRECPEDCRAMQKGGAGRRLIVIEGGGRGTLSGEKLF